jgi:hypothetical protein
MPCFKAVTRAGVGSPSSLMQAMAGISATRRSSSGSDLGEVVEHARLVRHRFCRRRHHHRGGAQVRRHAAQADGGRGAGMAGADDHRQVPCSSLHGAGDQRLALAVEHAVGFAEHPQHGDTVDADPGIEAHQPIEGFEIEAAVFVERRRQYGKHAAEIHAYLTLM